MGSSTGALKSAAVRTGLTVEEYVARVNQGLLYCWRCRDWHAAEEFNKDSSRASGRERACRTSINAERMRLRVRHPRPALGQRVIEARNGDGKQARARVRYLVLAQILPDANDLACTDCGHVCDAGERLHEYDHYLGYAPENHESVEPVCIKCHHAREAARGTWSKATAAPQAAEAGPAPEAVAS